MAQQTGITAITIENFKGIGAPVTVPLRPITLLFGANSAGKSTIIQAIHYVRELLLRNNPDADIPLAGGNAIDLGGFRNMVHRHDLSRTIRIGFEITLDDDGLPNLDEITGTEFAFDLGYWETLEKCRIIDTLIPNLQEMVSQIPEGGSAAIKNRLELVKRNQELVAGRKPDINPHIRSASVQFGVSWDVQRYRPWISEARFSLDGTSLLTVKQETLGTTALVTDVAYRHPAIDAVFTPILGVQSEEGAATSESEFQKFFQDLEDSEGQDFLACRVLSDAAFLERRRFWCDEDVGSSTICFHEPLELLYRGHRGEITGDEAFVADAGGGVFDFRAVLIAAQDDADRRLVARSGKAVFGCQLGDFNLTFRKHIEFVFKGDGFEPVDGLPLRQRLVSQSPQGEFNAGVNRADTPEFSQPLQSLLRGLQVGRRSEQVQYLFVSIPNRVERPALGNSEAVRRAATPGRSWISASLPCRASAIFSWQSWFASVRTGRTECPGRGMSLSGTREFRTPTDQRRSRFFKVTICDLERAAGIFAPGREPEISASKAGCSGLAN